jgi:biotin transport system substrate-specific component
MTSRETLIQPAPATLADTALARAVLLVLGGAGLTALAAQVSFLLPWTAVPYTLQTGAVLLVGVALGSRLGAASMALYVVAGAVGLPVFAAGRSGIMSEAGGLTLTFGYLIGFVLAAALVGRLAERGWDRHPASSAGLMALGNFVIYLVGVPVLAIVGGLSAGQAIWSGALVFLAWDAAKIAAAAVLLPLAWRVTGERR